MSQYDADAADAFAVIEAAGATVTVTRTVPGGYDPLTDTTAAATVTPHITVGLLLPLSGRDLAFLPETRIGSETGKFLIPGQGMPFRLAAGDTVTDPGGGDAWTITALKILAPDGTPILFTAFVER